jgi:hypothetical protein
MKNTKTPPCYTVLDKSDNPVHIEYARRKVEYFCPDCKHSMIPKMGDVVSHHFAHKPNDDGSEIHCGGEGFRHFRVKTFVHTMLSSISRHKFAYDLSFMMEKAHGMDIPDISISLRDPKVMKDEFQVLAIEVVDTHPPSEEKRKRWGSHMLEITITNWDDDLIGNAATLAGALIPWLANFDKLIENIRLEQSKTEMVIEKLTNERVDQVDNFTKELEEEMKLLESSKSVVKTNYLVDRFYPNVWFGSFSLIKKTEEVYVPYSGYVTKEKGKPSFGVSIKAYSGNEPKPGDWVWIKQKNGKFQHGLLGEKIDEYEWEDGDFFITVFRHHLIGKTQQPPELENLLKNYKLLD